MEAIRPLLRRGLFVFQDPYSRCGMAATLELKGGIVRLEPLSERHLGDLLTAAADKAIWRFHAEIPPTTAPAMQAYVARALAGEAAGTAEPYAIVLRDGGRSIGSTRYLDIRPADRGVEIGATWITPSWQRTCVNTECKFLLLRRAFEGDLFPGGAVRVQFRVNSRNEKSKAAVLRLGAACEGRLRHDRAQHDGTFRDTTIYSIVAAEWTAVRTRLDALLSGERGGHA